MVLKALTVLKLINVAILNLQLGRISIFPPHGGESQRIVNLLEKIEKSDINHMVFSIGHKNSEKQYNGIRERVINGRRIFKFIWRSSEANE